MTEINSKYSPIEIEHKWYQLWLDNKLFKSVPDHREPYTIVIPPPNVTGVLHMGHMLNNTIQDVLIRKARLEGKNACWVPGTDHASIATEAKVVELLAEKGIKKQDLTRESFLSHAWDWKEKYGGIILEQLKKLGCSCDWDRTRFTMEPQMSDAVISTFIDLYQKGLIYKGVRMINWDPKGKTALSDEEVYHKEVDSKLFYIKYPLLDSEEHITVATTRPETMFGDTAICVNPNDSRYFHLKGKFAILPLVGKHIPIIFDDYVDPEYGTGALKVTPAHDINDYNLGLKYHLPAIDVFNEDGTLNENAFEYNGKDRFEVRKLVAQQLEELGLISKIESIKNKNGYSERTHAVIEPRLSSQWFVNMKLYLEKNPQVLNDVLNDNITFYPNKLKNTYNHWLSNIKDWCISRQLWWGQQIPAFYLSDGTYVVCKTAEEAIIEFEKQGKKVTIADLKQDEDVLDTWFSSWLWPISVFDGIQKPDNEDINYYYPTNDLVTAPEIMFFWVARMIMAGYEFRNKLPFKNVYYTGIVRDKQRRKMSKSLGNSPDPIPMIEQYGADSVRMGMLLCSPAGNDILFDISQIEQGRNFCNKIWNAYRLVSQWETNSTLDISELEQTALDWINAKLAFTQQSTLEMYKKFKLSEVLMELYKLIWDDFCSWFLEMVKPAFGVAISQKTKTEVQMVFTKIMQNLHPFMPFITEEIYHHFNPNLGYINQSSYPVITLNQDIINQSERPIELITQIRNKRNENGISPKLNAFIEIKSNLNKDYDTFKPIIEKLANCKIKNKVEEQIKILIKQDEINLEFENWKAKTIDKDVLIKELNYLEGFLNAVNSKLTNEKFMANAKPEMIEKEKQKQLDALSKIEKLKKEIS